MKKIALILVTVLAGMALLTGCSPTAKESPVKKDPKCDYRPAPFGGCETIYFDGGKCVVINEGQCKPNEYQIFKTLDECQKLCE